MILPTQARFFREKEINQEKSPNWNLFSADQIKLFNQICLQFDSRNVLSIFSPSVCRKIDRNFKLLPLSSELSQINRNIFCLRFRNNENTPERNLCEFFFFLRQLIQFLSQFFASEAKKLTHETHCACLEAFYVLCHQSAFKL